MHTKITVALSLVLASHHISPGLRQAAERYLLGALTTRPRKAKRASKIAAI